MDGYTISTDQGEMDLSVIHGFISRSYWAENIPVDTMRRAMVNSLCFGIFLDSGEQVGFARMVTDSATFAYLADVFILEEHQGRGLSKWLMNTILEHPQLQGLRRIILATADAHGLYQRYGFTALAKPDRYMEIINPDVYKELQ